MRHPCFTTLTLGWSQCARHAPVPVGLKATAQAVRRFKSTAALQRADLVALRVRCARGGNRPSWRGDGRQKGGSANHLAQRVEGCGTDMALVATIEQGHRGPRQSLLATAVNTSRVVQLADRTWRSHPAGTAAGGKALTVT